jgi:uncharacterized protein with HEPN domain
VSRRSSGPVTPRLPSWKRIAGFGDVVGHAYFHVDLKEVWRIVQEDVPPLVGLLEPLVPPAAE